MVFKKNEGWRPCGENRRLNNVTVPARYSLPNIAYFSFKISGSTVFSKLNLQKEYHQVPVASKDIQKTAIIIPSVCLSSYACSFASGMLETPSIVLWT